MPLDPNAPIEVRRGRSGRPWERLKHQVYTEETHCWLCHLWVDQRLNQRHPMSRSVDHVIPLAAGGPPLERSNCRLAHRRCNSIRANKLRAKKQPRKELIVDASTL